MKYLGVDRRRFSTLITKDVEVDEKIKVIGKTLNFQDIKIFSAIIKSSELDTLIGLDGVINII